MKYTFGQLSFFLILFLPCLVLCGCSVKNESPVIPPVTSPLSRDYIGYGVITDSFTHITRDPDENSASLGYLRRGSLVKIIRRQTVRSGESFHSWVLIDGIQYGWLKEVTMDIFETESQAKTASEFINR